MSAIKLEAYVVRFCVDDQCNHVDEFRCPNVLGSKFYVDPKGIGPESVCFKINKGIGVRLVTGHDNDITIGRVDNASIVDKGIVLGCTIDDKHTVDALRRQYNSYTRNYTKNITFFQYIKNVFSGVSMSHHPITWNVNHVGLVNIPGRLGTGIKYFKAEDEPLVKRPENKNRVNDFIAAHCVAFLRNPNREKRLSINNKFSLYPGEKEYIYASYDYNISNVSALSPFESKPSVTMEPHNNVDLSELYNRIGRETILASLLPSMGLTKQDPINNSIQQQTATNKRPISLLAEDPAILSHKRTKVDVVDQREMFNKQLEDKMINIEDKLSQMTEFFEVFKTSQQQQQKTTTSDQQPPIVSEPQSIQEQPKPAVIEASGKYDIAIDSNKLKNALIENLFEQIKNNLD